MPSAGILITKLWRTNQIPCSTDFRLGTTRKPVVKTKRYLIIETHKNIILRKALRFEILFDSVERVIAFLSCFAVLRLPAHDISRALIGVSS